MKITIIRNTQLKIKTRKTQTATVTALLIIGLLISAIPMFILKTNAAVDSGWTLVNDARSVKAYPDLREYVWQKNATMPPNGQYDKIGLHRLVKTGVTPKGVVFIASGGSGSGQNAISNPPEDTFTKTESYGYAYYLANRGFDVYSIDERRQFIPITMNTSQVSFMKDWGWDVLMSDYKESISKAKEVSGASKIFMMGTGTGAVVTKNYASEFWKDDLQGMILLSEQNTPTVNITNTYNLTAAIANMIATGNWSKVNMALQNILGSRAALENPGAPAPPTANPPVNPATNKTWANVTEFLTFAFHYYPGFGGPGGMSNLLGGIGNITELLYGFANTTVYLPTRQDLESTAMADWTNSPYVTYDFNDHYKEINIPSLTIAAGLYKNATGQYKFVNDFASPDFSTIYLANYGVYDVHNSNYNIRDVNEPVYQWLVNQLPAPQPTSTPTPLPTPSPTPAPTPTPTPKAKPTPTPQATIQPSPTATPDNQETAQPTTAIFAIAVIAIILVIAVIAIVINKNKMGKK